MVTQPVDCGCAASGSFFCISVFRRIYAVLPTTTFYKLFNNLENTISSRPRLLYVQYSIFVLLGGFESGTEKFMLILVYVPALNQDYIQ